MSEHSFSRKTITGGGWSSPRDGNPSLSKQVTDSFPGKKFIILMNGNTVKFLFDDSLSGAEITTLTNTHNNWNPDPGNGGFAIKESDLKYSVQEVSGSKVLKESYYSHDLPVIGFSGLGKENEYSYSGNKVTGFSSRYYDIFGQVVHSELVNLSTDSNGNRISRKV